MEKYCCGSFPIGPVTFTAAGGKLTAIEFGGSPDARKPPGGVLELAVRELEDYFSGALRKFTVPWSLPPDSSLFLLKALEAMAQIPYGRTETYGGLARKIGSAPRAVGGAAARNPIPIIVPCHRLVAAKGLGGYAGDWEKGKALSVKKFLLELEAGQSGATSPVRNSLP